MTFDQHWLQDILCLKASSMFSENGCFALPFRKLELLKKKCFLQTPLSVNHLSFILTFVQHLTQIPSKVTRLLVFLAWVYYAQGLVFYWSGFSRFLAVLTACVHAKQLAISMLVSNCEQFESFLPLNSHFFVGGVCRTFIGWWRVFKTNALLNIMGKDDLFLERGCVKYVGFWDNGFRLQSSTFFSK